jgi:calcineurin-like phosphoesterase family protein
VNEWLIADTHFGSQPRARRNASGLDGSTLDHMICERWRVRIKDGDLVWHLGDVGDLNALACLPGTKQLVHGADGGLAFCKASGHFADVRKRVLLERRGQQLILVHRPADAAANDEVVLHGHLHTLHDGRPNFVCLSVDQTEWAPISFATAIGRAASGRKPE